MKKVWIVIKKKKKKSIRIPRTNVKIFRFFFFFFFFAIPFFLYFCGGIKLQYIWAHNQKINNVSHHSNGNLELLMCHENLQINAKICSSGFWCETQPGRVFVRFTWLHIISPLTFLMLNSSDGTLFDLRDTKDSNHWSIRNLLQQHNQHQKCTTKR